MSEVRPLVASCEVVVIPAPSVCHSRAGGNPVWIRPRENGDQVGDDRPSHREWTPRGVHSIISTSISLTVIN